MYSYYNVTIIEKRTVKIIGDRSLSLILSVFSKNNGDTVMSVLNFEETINHFFF